MPVMTLLLSPTMLLLPVIVVPPETNPGRKISISLIAVAVAVLVLVLLDDALGALPVAVDCVGADVPVTFPEPLTAPFVVVAGAVDVVFPAPLTARLVVLVPAVVPLPLAVVVVPLGLAVWTGALVPLTAVPDPLTVDALTVVDPEALTLPEPLLVAVTVVEPEAFVTALVGLVVVGVLVVLLSTGAAVPLAPRPEPLTVAAFTVVDPAALIAPLPLLVALTVVEPEAFVIAVCANAGAPPKPSSAALTAAATRLLGGCSFFIVISRHSFPLHRIKTLPEASKRPRGISRDRLESQ